MNRWIFCFLFLFASFQCVVQAQSKGIKVIGTLFDAQSRNPLSGASVLINNVKNANEVFKSPTNKNGSFSIDGLNSGPDYQLSISSVGYKTEVRHFKPLQETIDFGNIYLSVLTQDISEVVVNGALPSATQKGDTLEVNANAFKTVPNASAEQLVLKMPGIVVENGVIKAQGEEVKKVLVDGKEFFGEDPSVALKNLPAEVISKIQVFDKLSEQAQFDGFDDGNSVKTINIITKSTKQNGQFGKFYAGSNFDDRYNTGGNLNLFKGKRRISIIELANNVNQQNFTQQDIQGIASLSNTGKHDGGFVIGQQNGVNTTKSLGLNYSDNFGKKIQLTSSYFYNSTKNYTTLFSKKDKFLFPRPDHFSNESDTASTQKYNHRFNMRLEYDINKANTLVMTPKISIQDNHADKYIEKLTTKNAGSFVNAEKLNSHNQTDAYNFENEIVFRHKFNKSKRTLSYSLTASASSKDSKNTKNGILRSTLLDTIPEYQTVDDYTMARKISSKLEYNEPLSKRSLLNFSISNAYTHSQIDLADFEPEGGTGNLVHSDSLSNVYDSYYFSNHAGMAYRIKSDKIKFSLGTEFQYAVLNGKQVYPLMSNVQKVFTNYLPSMQFNYTLNKKEAIKFLYHTSTNSPNISQLQNAIDNFDKTNLATGNPTLKQEYTHSLKASYAFANPETSINYSVNLMSEYTLNYIGNQSIVARKDTLIQDAKVLLLKNMQLSRPVNLDYYRSARILFNYGFPLRVILNKINLFSGFNYAQTPAYINQTLNRYTLLSTTNGLVLSSNISQKIDYTVSYTTNYSVVKNSVNTSSTYVFPKYFYQSLAVKFNLIVGKGIVLENELVDQSDKGFESLNKNFVLWNVAIGKKLFPKQNGEIKVSAFDLLNQNVNIAHSVTPQYIKDAKYNTLNRFFALTFTFDLNSAPDQQVNEVNGKKKKDKKGGHKKDFNN